MLKAARRPEYLLGLLALAPLAAVYVQRSPPPDARAPGDGLRHTATSSPTPARPVTAPALPLTRAGAAAIQAGIHFLNRGDWTTAAQAFQRAVQTDPRSGLAHDYLGVALLRERRYSPALREFQTEIRLGQDPGYGWARAADVHLAEGDLQGAIDALERAALLRPDVAQIQFNLGMLYPRTMEMGRALKALDRGLEMEPGNHYAQYLRGIVLYRAARLADAEASLKEAIRLQPAAGAYHFALAQVYLRLHASPANTARARNELQTALDLNNSEPAPIHYALAVCWQRQEHWDAARQELETAIRISPNTSDYYYLLREMLLRLGRVEEARQAQTRFLALRAKDDLELQRSFYEQEAQRNPDHADAYFQLAAFLARSGDPAGAGAALKRAKELLAEGHGSPDLASRIAVLSARLRPAAERASGGLPAPGARHAST